MSDVERAVELLASQREIEALIYRMGYALEDGDFDTVGELLAHATLGADLIGEKAFRGKDEIKAQYERTNVVYEGRGRATREIYTNILVDIDLDANRATSTTAYTVAQQPPGDRFELLVAGRYLDEFERVDGRWRWTDRFIAVQFKNDLDRHMHRGTQPYNQWER